MLENTSKPSYIKPNTWHKTGSFIQGNLEQKHTILFGENWKHHFGTWAKKQLVKQLHRMCIHVRLLLSWRLLFWQSIFKYKFTPIIFSSKSTLYLAWICGNIELWQYCSFKHTFEYLAPTLGLSTHFLFHKHNTNLLQQPWWDDRASKIIGLSTLLT